MPLPEAGGAAAAPSPPKLLAVSFSFPPLAYPRSIQVARLLKYTRLPTVVVCADERGARRDPTLEPDAEARLEAVLRVPFSVTRARRYANALAYRLSPALWERSVRRPDEYARWKRDALAAFGRYARDHAYSPDALATFSQPATGHLVGLELKRRLGVPWVAHFSDPWVDNPFHRSTAPTRDFNLALEREVIGAADRLVFTSRETVELVMRKYPAEWARKASVLPQCFDPALFGARGRRDREGGPLVVRYVGNFYGGRTPAPLLRALEALRAHDPASLAGVTFELVGVTDESVLEGAAALPEGLVSARPPVAYAESLRLMTEADGLLIIDAPAEVSVFLPSKLIDYAGAARPVMGLTPEGAAASLIRRLGGRVADPSDIAAGAETLRDFVGELRRRAESGDAGAWGDPTVRRAYEATHLAREFEKLILGMLGRALISEGSADE